MLPCMNDFRLQDFLSMLHSYLKILPKINFNHSSGYGVRWRWSLPHCRVWNHKARTASEQRTTGTYSARKCIELSVEIFKAYHFSVLEEGDFQLCVYNWINIGFWTPKSQIRKPSLLRKGSSQHKILFIPTQYSEVHGHHINEGNMQAATAREKARRWSQYLADRRLHIPC